jgi:Mn2+/Fe2+ NRAMP family transporter
MLIEAPLQSDGIQSMLTLHHARKFANRFGPGLITGAADDDPSGLAAYSQAGAQFGVGLPWTLAFTTPLMIGLQMVSARIGWLTGPGLGSNREILGKYTLSRRHLVLAWFATAVMAGAVIAMIVTG